ncbi:PH domain-containing protein [Streptomyces sp. DSM 44915]|uniref:PH domain-containing protein n=1 Tax=Streptomyces chisholmiae TaxID=3075540 RepID=A0ABU2JWN7_9ACTN|nr:PH domain-containing protein [Streptomyces sp. DSM 44915]MDT0269272.1 PH domain-containing protein [Streptomyces sp. DSM 44915]
MPLTFLSAEHDAHVSPTEAPLPHGQQDHWRRPYRPGPWRVGGAAIVLLLAAYLLISAVIIAAAGPPTGASATAVCAAVAIALALRMLRVGIWVSPRGLRRVGLLRTQTLRWREVASVRTVQQPVRWLGLPRSVQGQALEVHPRKGEPWRALVTDHSADFLRRSDAFEQAADVLEAWAAEHQVEGGRRR